MQKLYYFLTENLWFFGAVFMFYLAYHGIRKREIHEKEAKKKLKDAKKSRWISR